jgi:hypothetical protein
MRVLEISARKNKDLETVKDAILIDFEKISAD